MKKTNGMCRPTFTEMWQQPFCPVLDPQTHKQESKGEHNNEEHSRCDQQAGHLGDHTERAHHTERVSQLAISLFNLCVRKLNHPKCKTNSENTFCKVTARWCRSCLHRDETITKQTLSKSAHTWLFSSLLPPGSALPPSPHTHTHFLFVALITYFHKHTHTHNFYAQQQRGDPDNWWARALDVCCIVWTKSYKLSLMKLFRNSK